ncbi:MAG: hypothetical protein Q9169_002822 [Polycauliona sp. 2 TL-2023]
MEVQPPAPEVKPPTPETETSAVKTENEDKELNELEVLPVAAQLSPFRKLFTKEIVTVEVGSSKVPFVFHKGLICSRSRFFEAAINGSFREATTQSVHLKDDDPDVFDMVHKWFYTNRITIASDGKDEMAKGSRLLNAYILADKLDIPFLCDTVINILSKSYMSYQIVSARMVLEIYGRMGPNDRLRKWIFAVILVNHLHTINEITVRAREASSHCPELLLDLLSAMKEKCGPSPPKTSITLCDFHRHKKDEPCFNSGKTYSYAQVRLDGTRI